MTKNVSMTPSNYFRAYWGAFVCGAVFGGGVATAAAAEYIINSEDISKHQTTLVHQDATNKLISNKHIEHFNQQ